MGLDRVDIREMEDDKLKLDTIRDEDHLERVVFYVNSLTQHYQNNDIDKVYVGTGWTASQKKRMYQEHTIILMYLMTFRIKKTPVKYPLKCKFAEPHTREVFAVVLKCVDEEEKDL